MAFPVDILTQVDHETLELTAKEYMSQLPYRNTEYFSLSDSKQIEIGLCNVSFVPLYGTETEKKLLALFSPDDYNTVVGLYLLDRWWGVEDVLKTVEPSKTGLIEVSTLGERIVLYVLNRIVLRKERSSEDVFFLCHREHESAKILWKDGEAIGFYSFQPKGSICRNFVTQCYLLPVMDTTFVRKSHRGQGYAIKILEDFVGSFRNEDIGLKFPLSEAMFKVCEKYFGIYPEDKELLWEVEKIGSPFQRTLIANRLQQLKLKEKDQVVSKLSFDEEDATAPMEIEFRESQETTEYTVEILEETIIDITKEADDIPVTRRGGSSNLKRRAIRENSEERISENKIRVEDIEAGVESSVEVAAVESLNTFSAESEMVLRSSVDTVTATVTNFAVLGGSQIEETHEIAKDIVTATSEGIGVTHITTAGEIKSQSGSKDECEIVIEECTIDIQGATIGSIDQNQLESVVDIEIVKMSTGNEEGKNENLEKNKVVEEVEPVWELETEEINQMPDELKEEKTVSETEVTEKLETQAKSTEKEQANWAVEITENNERTEDEVMAGSGKDLIEESRDDNTGQEKGEPKDEDTVLQQSAEIKDQIEMEADSVREVLTTEEVLCDQPKQNEAETEVSEPNQTMTNKDTLIEKAEQVFNKSKLPQKRASGLTPSRMSKRLRHQPAEKDLKTTESVKTGQQRSKHHSKVMMQDKDFEQSTDEPEHGVSEVIEKIQEAQIENKAESEVEQHKEKDMLAVETVSTMDVEFTQVKETVFPEVSELVERKETDQEAPPPQSSVESPEIKESKTTPEEEEETVENSTVMLTMSEAKVVLVDLHELSPKEAGDNQGEISIPEKEEMNVDAKLRTIENPEREELIPEDVIPGKNEMANTNADETASVECGSSELLRAAEKDDEEKGHQITKVTGEIPLIQTEDDENVIENRVEDIKTLENKEANLTGQMDRDVEMSSLAQEEHVQEEEVPISTERHLRRRTIRVQTPLIRKSRCVQKQNAEADIEDQERHSVVSKNKTDTILMTKQIEDEINQDVNKMENKEEHFTELEPVEEPNMSRNEYEKTSAITEETVDVCIPMVTTETSLESFEEMVNTNTEETTVPESSELPLGIEIDDQEKELQIVKEKVSLVEPGKEVENDDGTPLLKLQRATVVLVDLSKLYQNTEGECFRASEDLTHIQTEEKLELYEPDKSEQELSYLALEKEQEEEEVQTQEDTEKTPEEEKVEEENTPEEQNKLNKQEMTFEVQKPTEDLATMPAEGSLLESNTTENKESEDKGVSGLAQEDAVQENLEEKAPVCTQQSLRRRTIRVQSPPRRQSRRIQKQAAEVSEDKTQIVPMTEKEVNEVDQGVEIVDKEKAPQTSIVDATEKLIPFIESDPEDNVIEEGDEEINKLENMKTHVAVTKDTDEETSEVKEANLEEQLNEPLDKIDKETAEPETSIEFAPVVDKEQTVYTVGGTTIQTEEKISQVSLPEAEPDKEGEKDDATPVMQLQIDPEVRKEQTYVVVGTTSQTEEKFSQVESTEPDQSDSERITRRSLRLSVKSVTATQKTRKSTRLHKVELEPVKETTISRNELELEHNTNVEETTAVELETSELLMGEEIVDKEEVSQIVEENKPTEAEPHEEAVKYDGTPVILQTESLLLVDLNKLSKNTEEQIDTLEVLTHFHTEEQLELHEPDNNEYHLTSEEDKQNMTVEGQKPTEDMKDGKERKTVKEYNVVIDEDVEESVSTADHPKTTTMEDKTNISQETENNQDFSLKEKQMDSDLEMSSHSQEAPEAVQEILEEEASVSTDRKLRRRTVKIQSPPSNKYRCVQRPEAEVSEDKTGTVHLLGEEGEEVNKEGAEIDKEETLQKTTVDGTEDIVSLIEGEPDENVIEKGFEEINNLENKETNLGNEATPEMENEIENEKETAETEKPMGMEEVLVVNKEQTYVLEKTTIQAEEEQMESSETSENKSGRTTRRSLRISSQSVTSSQKTRKSARLLKAELEPVKGANMGRNEDGDVSKRVETTSDEQDNDISNDKGRVYEPLPEISTDVEEDETMTLIKLGENENLLEMDKMQKDVEGGVREEGKAEPSQQNTEQEQEKAGSLGENVRETDLTNEFKTTAVEEAVALENSEQEAAFITRSLRYRTVTVQSTPRSKSKRLHRQEPELETDDLNVTSELKQLEAKEAKGIIQTNKNGKSDKSETKDEILFEILESNSGSQVNTEKNKTQEENTEREDMPVPNEQEEDVSIVQKEPKPHQERENEGAAEGSSADLEETAMERRSLRKRMTVEEAASRKSKRLRKQEHDDDSEQDKEAFMGRTDSVEVTFIEDSVEMRSDATAAAIEDSNIGEEILQKIQKHAQEAKSDGDCHVHKDTETDAGESQEEQKESRSNKTQSGEDQEEVLTGEIVEEVIEPHVDLESSTNKGFTLALEVEESSDHEENKGDEESRVVMEAPKEISTSAEKYDKGVENLAVDDEEGLAIGKHFVQSSSSTTSTRRKSIRLHMHESKTKEDESDSESEVEQTAKQRPQRKRKAITDSTSARRSRRHVRARIV